MSPSSPAGILAPNLGYAPVGLFCKFCSIRPARYKFNQSCNPCYQRVHYGKPISLTVKSHVLTPVCTYKAAHTRVRDVWGPADQYPCVFCYRRSDAWAYDHTDPNELQGPGSGKTAECIFSYSAFPEFYMPLCMVCHREFDGVGVNDDW